MRRAKRTRIDCHWVEIERLVLQVKDAKSNDDTVRNENELMKEALLMAQVDPHKNLVSIIGVVTRGRPKTLVLNYCEHGYAHEKER